MTETTTHVRYSSDDLEIALTHNKTFKTNQRHIINHVGVSAADAKQLLSSEWLLHRYPQGERIDDVTQRLKDYDDKLMWSITYARREIEKREYALRGNTVGEHTDDFSENDAVELGLKLSDAFRSQHGYPINTDIVIDEVFSHKGTRDFIRLVLAHGKSGALELSGLSRKQFSGMLRRVEKHCDKHREDIYTAIQEQEVIYMQDEMKLVQRFIDLLEVELEPDRFAGVIRHFLLRNSKKDVVQRILYTAGIDEKHIQDFIANFGNGKQNTLDYRLVNAVYEEREFLEQEEARFGIDSY